MQNFLNINYGTMYIFMK